MGGPYTINFTGNNAWVEYTLPNGLNIIANTQYTVSVTTGSEAAKYYPYSVGGLTSSGNNGNKLSFPVNAGVYTTVLGTVPTNFVNGNNYFRVVVFTPEGVPSEFHIGLDAIGNKVDSPLPNSFVAIKTTSNQNVSVNKLSLFNESGANGTVRLGIYSVSVGNPGTLLAQTTDLTFINGWISGSIVSTNLTSGSNYWLVFNFSNTGNHPKYNGTGVSNYKFTASTYGVLPATAPSGLVTTNATLSFYASGGKY